MTNLCILTPEAPNGEPSRLYQDFLKKYKIPRPIVNFIYAVYKSQNLIGKMEQMGIPKNAQGEHSAQDVMDFLHVNEMLNEIGTLHEEERRNGFVDNNGIRIDFPNAKEALDKADNFNTNHNGLVATVVQHGDVFNIIASEKNSRTHLYSDFVKERLKAWDILKQAFAAKGVDLDTIPSSLQGVLTAYNPTVSKYLRNLKSLDIDNMYKRDAMILLSLSPNSRHIQNLVHSFGSIENAAEALDLYNHGANNLSVAQKTLLNRAIKDAKNYSGVDIDAVISQVDSEVLNMQLASPEQAVKEELQKLNKKYHIDANEIHIISDKINSLSEAAANAVIILERQIRALQRERGRNAEGKKLEDISHTLQKELTNKRYYFGMVRFMNEAATQISEIDNMLNNLPQTGTELEKAFGTAKILQNIMDIKHQYYDLVSALADEGITIDESISQVDIDNIRQQSAKLKEFFDKKERVLNDLTENTMLQLMLNIVGDKTGDGQPIINAIRMAAKDSSRLDFLYSMGRASDLIIATAGTITRNAEDSRDYKINDMALRIRKATDRLYKSGSNSEFMYEDDGHIASDIDWVSYKNARKAELKSLYQQGLDTFEIKQRIENWEDANTEDRLVDRTNGRTERVPNALYRKNEDFQEGWSQEQKEYYDTVMQIKGEIGSMLPTEAQHQYLPPQIRRNFLDALSHAKSYKDILTAIRNKAENLYKVREDDENYNTNGIIDGDEYRFTRSDSNNNVLREIPIFFINKVEEGELLKDFSSGLQALAGTAINYDALSRTLQVAEFMRDFTIDRHLREPLAEADIVDSKFVRVTKDLYKKAKGGNTAALMEGFVAQHYYGQRLAPNGFLQSKRMTKVMSNIIAYTSFKGLATNVKGAVSNYIMGEWQMFIEGRAGEFYNLKDFAWAHTKLFGKAGVMGEIAELVTNNINHRSVLMRELFDPLQENFSDKSHTRYYKSTFRQLLSKDCSFIGYTSGEYLIHYVNMYSVLHHTKVIIDGKVSSLYDAFEVVEDGDNNSKLKLKQNVTDLDGNPITDDFIDKIRRRIRYVNQTTHGSMNDEDKGLIHQYMLGRMAMNFRQWMVEHYSRRFRKRHFDGTLQEYREGYWMSLYYGLMNDDTKDTWKRGNHMKAIGMFMKDFYTFMFRAQSQWHNLDDMQKYNILRVKAEMEMLVALQILSFALGDPDRHKREFWRRFWIYQTKRLILDTEASMPHPHLPQSFLTILNSPMASINTINAFLYTYNGLTNGDLFEQIKSGDHKGENKYFRNIVKYVLPFYKDWEQMDKMDTDNAIFKAFEDVPSNH